MLKPPPAADSVPPAVPKPVFTLVSSTAKSAGPLLLLLLPLLLAPVLGAACPVTAAAWELSAAVLPLPSTGSSTKSYKDTVGVNTHVMAKYLQQIVSYLP